MAAHGTLVAATDAGLPIHASSPERRPGLRGLPSIRGA
jgi:hypothetical protein